MLNLIYCTLKIINGKFNKIPKKYRKDHKYFPPVYISKYFAFSVLFQVKERILTPVFCQISQVLFDP